jgi:O-antigen ligase
MFGIEQPLTLRNRVVTLFDRTKLPYFVNFLLEVTLYLLPIFFLFKRSYATSIYIWIFVFYALSLVLDNRRPDFQSALTWPVILLLSAVVLASTMSIGLEATWREGKRFFYGVALFFVLIDQISRRKIILERYLWLLLALSFFLSLDALWQFHHGFDVLGNEIYRGRVTAVFLNPNYLGFFLSGVVPIHVYFGQSSGTMFEKSVHLGLLIFNLAIIVLTGCRSVWLGVVVFYFFWLALYSDKRVRAFSGVLAAVALPAAYIMNAEMITQRLLETAQFFEGARVVIWRDALTTIWDHPILGAGLDSYKDLAPELHYRGSAMVLSAPHFFPFEVWQTSGIFALCIFLFFLYRSVQINVSYMKRRGRYAFLFPSLVLVFLASVLSIPFFSRYVTFYFWLFLGLLFGAMKAEGFTPAYAKSPDHQAKLSG